MPPRSRASWQDAYDAQMALWRWYRTEDGQRWMAQSYRLNSGDMPEDTKAQLQDYYHGEMGRLIDCDPLYVSADMCELVDHAMVGFKPEALLETDLITPRGFMFYERPFLVPDRYEIEVEIKGFSWTRMWATDSAERAVEIRKEMIERGSEFHPGTGGNPGGMESDDPVNDEDWLDQQEGVHPTGLALTVYAKTDVDKLHESMKARAASMPPLLAMHVTPWYFGMTFDGNEWDVLGKPTGAEWWWRIAQTTFRLMQHKIAVRRFERPDRASRREAKALRFPDEQSTVVVRLRAEEGERKEPSGEKANYSHRFIRRGHWRQQWYASLDTHRQIWIDPTVVGDPDLPLVIKPRRAFKWDR